MRLRLNAYVLIFCLLTPFFTYAQSFSEQIDQLSHEGDMLLQQRDLPNALIIYRELLSLYQQAGDDQHAGETAVTIGSLYNSLGDYESAFTYFEQAVAIFQQLGNQKDEAMTLIYMGHAHAAWSRYAKAVEQLQQALAIARQIDDRAGKWSALKGLGDTYLKLGRFQNTLDAYGEALTLSGPEESCRSELTLLASIGSAHTALGQYREAIAQYRQTLAFLTDHCPEFSDREDERKNLEGEILLSIAITYLRLGDYDKALHILQEVLAIFRETGYTLREATTLAKLGGIYEEWGDYVKALGFYEQALAVQQASPDPLGHITALNDSAKAWIRFCQATGNQHFHDALSLYEEALRASQTAGAKAVEARILNNIGEISLHMGRNGSKPGQFEQALQYFQDALNLQQALHDDTNAWITLNNMGQVYECQGDYQEAFVCYQKAIELLEEIVAFSCIEEFTVSLRAQVADTYQRIVLLLLRTGQPEQAFEFSERARARAFFDQLGNTRLHLRTTTPSGEIEQEYALRNELAELERELRQEYQKPDTQQNQDRLHFLEAQRNKIRREYEDARILLKAKSSEYASFVTVEPLSLRHVQALLNKKTTLLSYFVTSDRVVAFIITGNSFKILELPINEQELRAAIDDVRQPAGVHDPIPDALEFLYKRLITPLKPHLTTPLIGIIPHGVLHYLPFAALTDGNHYLNDEYALFSLPGATILKFLREKRKTPDNTVLALANSQAEGLPALLFADQEVRTIATFYARYYQTSFFSHATETTFKTLAGQFSILHLAAHGELNIANPLFSRIVLVPDDQNDGALEVHEIYELDLNKTDLVVLSACDTQLGKLSRGDDIVGLTRAFISAGSPSVLASLWKVDDRATRDFMTTFYLCFKLSNSKADALRDAQHLIRAKYPHPYYWAAFVLTGEP